MNYNMKRTSRFYGPLKVLAFSATDTHSSLSSAFCRHLLKFVSFRNPFTPSGYLILGLPLLLLAYGLLSNT